MRSGMLMNVLWYEEITPEEAADHIGITERQFFDKIAGYEGFTADEISELTRFLNMTQEEADEIFFGG